MAASERPVLPEYDSAAREGTLGVLRKLADHRELLVALVVRDVSARYKQSVLGIYWTILNPLASALVYTVVFAAVIRVATPVPYPLFVLAGLLAWNFLANSLYNASTSLVGMAGLLTKVAFPREILPIAAVAARVVDFACSLAVLLVLMVAFGQPLHWTLLAIPALLATQLALTTGIAFAIAAANLFYRDVGQLLNLALTLWMFLTPVFYPADLIPREYGWLRYVNPMAPLVEAYRQVILLGQLPGPVAMAGLATTAAVALIGGYAAFKALEPLFAEVV